MAILSPNHSRNTVCPTSGSSNLTNPYTYPSVSSIEIKYSLPTLLRYALTITAVSGVVSADSFI